jgi:hypothetical protein
MQTPSISNHVWLVRFDGFAEAIAPRWGRIHELPATVPS